MSMVSKYTDKPAQQALRSATSGYLQSARASYSRLALGKQQLPITLLRMHLAQPSQPWQNQVNDCSGVTTNL